MFTTDEGRQITDTLAVNMPDTMGIIRINADTKFEQIFPAKVIWGVDYAGKHPNGIIRCWARVNLETTPPPLNFLSATPPPDLKTWSFCGCYFEFEIWARIKESALASIAFYHTSLSGLTDEGIPILLQNTSAFEAKNLDEATGLIKWMCEKVKTENEKIVKIWQSGAGLVPEEEKEKDTVRKK